MGIQQVTWSPNSGQLDTLAILDGDLLRLAESSPIMCDELGVLVGNSNVAERVKALAYVVDRFVNYGGI